MFVSAIVAGGSALLGAYSTRKAGKDAAAAQEKANQGDPRVSGILHGSGKGDPGLLAHYQGMLSKPQNTALDQYGQANLNYLSTAPGDMLGIRDAAQGLIKGNQAPTIANAAWAQGSMVDAPKQNNMDLTGSYNSFINGDRGGNTRLTQAIQGGIDQSKNAFSQMQGNATENLMENIMPSIRSNSVLSGQYGGSRQGIAEGNAIGDFAKAQQQTINQFGQNNTNAAVGAQANAYETDANRALSATQGLGAQQYGVASQNANTKNAAEFGNVNQMLDISKSNAQFQQANNALNQSGAQAGSGMLSGLLGNAYGVGQNQDNYGINQATKVNNLMQPYLSQNPTQPVAPTSNPVGGALGGAMMGLGLYNQFKPQGGAAIGANNGMGTGNFNFQPTALGTNSGALQSMDWFKG